MKEHSPPIKLKAAKILFRLLFDAIDFGTVELTDHFTQRQRERNIDLADVHQVIMNGHIKKEYKPDSEHSSWRWSLNHAGVTIVFSFNDKSIVFVTCWKGKEPKEGER